jgi:lipid II:glycine glycyltransferase (peptidoglycan interpeptide bridge formation enzyme)
MRPATKAEISRWDDLLARNPDGGHILQSRAWGEFKAHWGWRPRHLIAGAAAQDVAVLFLSRRVAGLGELWYSPKGPGILRPEALVPLLEDRAGLDGAFCLKVEPELVEGVDVSTWHGAGLVKAPRDVQINRATIIVDLRPDEDALFASFKSKMRYNIRLAARRGIVVRHVPVDDLSVEAMYRLMAQTQARAGFTLRRRDYFEGYWRLQNASGQGDLLFAFLGDEVLAGVFVTRFGRRAWYKDGGSSRRHQELMAPHLLQWETMRWLRRLGIESYDLVAVPRPSELHEGHPLYGLHRFKSGFSESVVEFVGTWDLPLRARSYALWNRIGERAAHQWSYRTRRDLWY